MRKLAAWQRSRGIARTVRRRSCRDIRRRSEAYNGLVNQVRYLTANTLAFDVPAATTSPQRETIVATGYDESLLQIFALRGRVRRDLVLHETTGELCEISADETLDNGR